MNGDGRVVNDGNGGGASVMLAAGGTGGHLFPAQALAEELGRRGIAVDLITDMRGDRYGMGFPARKIYQVPAATLSRGLEPLRMRFSLRSFTSSRRNSGSALAV